MYISKTQLESRLKGQSGLELKKREGVGRHHTIPHEKKVLIGVLAQVDTQENVAKAMGTSQENVSMISRGLSGPNLNPELKNDIISASGHTKESVSSKAIDILMDSLKVVGTKVGKEDAKDASSIAKNMATIVQKFTPQESNSGGFAPRIQINIHGTRQKSESEFESIEVEPVSA